MKVMLKIILYFILALLLMYVCYGQEMPEWFPYETYGPLTFPISENDCYKVSGKIWLSSWYKLEREDMGGAKYRALNIPAIEGASVVSITDGVCVKSKYDYLRIYGLEIWIKAKKGGAIWKYQHLVEPFVLNGMSVERGQRIGAVGHTGRTTGPHLRLEVDWDGKPIMVSPYFEKKWFCKSGSLDGVKEY